MMRKMSILVPLLLLFSPSYGHVLKFKIYTGSDMKTWNDAKDFCRQHHTDLVTIKYKNDNPYFHNGTGWIGLYREDATSPWKWSRGDEVAHFTNWDTDEPKSNAHCAFKYPSKEKWVSDLCDASHSFMCSDENLFLVRKNKTWEEALNHCRSLEGVDLDDPDAAYDQNHRYDLATLITPEDHAYARERAQHATSSMVWTGLRYLAGEWVWVGGEQVQYRDIKTCPHAKFCGTLNKDSTADYEIRKCNQRRNFFCYKRP